MRAATSTPVGCRDGSMPVGCRDGSTSGRAAGSAPRSTAVLWTAIGAGAVTAGSVAGLLLVVDGTLDAAIGAVLAVALAVLAHTAIRLALDPGRLRVEDDGPAGRG